MACYHELVAPGITTLLKKREENVSVSDDPIEVPEIIGYTPYSRSVPKALVFCFPYVQLKALWTIRFMKIAIIGKELTGIMFIMKPELANIPVILPDRDTGIFSTLDGQITLGPINQLYLLQHSFNDTYIITTRLISEEDMYRCLKTLLAKEADEEMTRFTK